MVNNFMENWRPGAMYTSELLWLKRQIEVSGIDVLIECGRQEGVSSLWYNQNLSKNIDIFSIDLDNRPDVLAKSIDNLQGTRVHAVTGNVFEVVPQLIERYRDKRIAIVEDAVKGWAGLALLLASAMFDNVIVIAQHNLHLGHKSRSFFEKISLSNVFPEYSDSADVRSLHHEFRENNRDLELATDRPIDHTSLGIISFAIVPRNAVLALLFKYKSEMGIWSPYKLYSAWQKNVKSYLWRQNVLSRYSLARFHSR